MHGQERDSEGTVQEECRDSLGKVKEECMDIIVRLQGQCWAKEGTSKEYCRNSERRDISGKV